ncbi:hypothetical protein TKK_0014432 [Trichogramma kaykai]
MGRRRVVRTLEEEQAFLAARRARNAENQRRRRQAARIAAIEKRRNAPIPEDYLGKMNILCMHCNAKHFEGVELEPTPEFPPELRDLFNGNHTKSINFFDHIRSYNNSLSFASFNANLITFQSLRRAPYCFKIQGQIYYQINTALYAAENENPLFG